MTGPKITALDSIKVTLSMAWRAAIIAFGYIIVLNWISLPTFLIAKIVELLTGHNFVDAVFQQLSNHPVIDSGGTWVFIQASILIVLASMTRDTLNTASYKTFKFMPGISKITNVKYILLLWLVFFLIPMICHILWHKLAPILQTLQYGNGIAEPGWDLKERFHWAFTVLNFVPLSLPGFVKFLIWALLNYYVITRGLFGIHFPNTQPDKYD